MTTLVAFTVLVALVGLERLAELVVSKRNAAWSMERGDVETGPGGVQRGGQADRTAAGDDEVTHGPGLPGRGPRNGSGP